MKKICVLIKEFTSLHYANRLIVIEAVFRNLFLRGCSADYNLRKDEMSEPDEELNQPASPTTDQQLRKIKEYLLESW